MAKTDIRRWIFGTSAWHIFRWYVLALALVLLGATLYFHWIVVSPRHFMQTVYVTKVELVYLFNSAPLSVMAGDPALRFVQPVWSFSGYTEDGSTFEILVQAVADQYVR